MGIFGNKKKPRSRDRPEEKLKYGALTPIWGALMGAKVRADLVGSEAVYSAVSRISNTMACMPLHLYRNHEIQHDDPRERCLAYAPNGSMTPYNLKMAIEASRLVHGTGYIMCVPAPDGITLDYLDPLDPARVQPLRNIDTGEIWYQITMDDGSAVRVHNCWVIALHHMSTDGVTGISPVEVLGGTLNYDRKIREVSLEQLAGFSDSIVLNYPTSLSVERRNEYTQSFLNAYKASRGHVIILEGGVTADKITGSMVDPKVLEVDNITKRKVASVYNMPPRMIGDASSSGYSTSEQDTMEYLKLTILPIVKQWEETLNRKLLTYEEFCSGYSFRFDMDALQRGDIAVMAEKHSKLVRSGGMTPNETRLENGLPPSPYGDHLFVSRDLIPVQVVVDHPELLLSGKMDKSA